MLLKEARVSDYADVVDLTNLAFRGQGEGASWNTEAHYIEGARLSERLLREDLKAKPDAHLLLHRDESTGTLLGTVWLEARQDDVWYLGLLTIRPDLQKNGLGRALLQAAEEFARSHGGRRVRMLVVNVRESLIAWYERRGYALTGETQPFPYGDDRFGRPLREGLCFVVLEKTLG